MYHTTFPTFLYYLPRFQEAREHIVSIWVAAPNLREVLDRHLIDKEYFEDYYALKVFDYFMDVVLGNVAIGDCPVIGKLLEYFKDRDVSAQELFVICSHFRKTMLTFSYEAQINDQNLFDEISDLFDQNFAGVLKRYTDTIFQKEQEIAKNVQLLGEYKKAIDESAIVSKTDINGVITYINDNFISRCGYSAEELIGTRHDIVWDDITLGKRVHETMTHSAVFHDTVMNRKKNGEAYYVDMTMLPIRDYQGKVSEYMEISYEVTSLIEATREAVAAGEAKEYFLSNMSHEIRTPLNAILGFVSLLQDEVMSERHQQYLNIIHNSGENLLSIINDILDFSKLQSGEFTIEPRPFNIHEQLSKTLELFVPSANEKQITLLSYFDPMIPHILTADILRIKQIVSNFISNAIKFSDPHSHIEVRVSCDRSRLIIKVRDWGIGLHESDISRIFDPFSQAHSSVEKLVGGTGLGLSICKKLAEHMDGSIEVVSQPGEGSTFILNMPVSIGENSSFHLFDPTPFRQMKIGLLRTGESHSKTLESLNYYLDFFGLRRTPITLDDLGAYELILFLDEEIDMHQLSVLRRRGIAMIAIMDHLSDRYDSDSHIVPLFFPFYCAKIYNAFQLSVTQKRNHDEHASAKKQRRFKGRILVAEDNLANQELIKVMLQRYGLEYLVVNDGQMAVDAFKNETFEMILMDEQMPVKNGLEATQEIIAYEQSVQRSHTPIVALTANVIKGAKERGMQSGYDEFLGKPVVIKEIERVFKTYLVEAESIMQEMPTEQYVALNGTVDLHALQEELQLSSEELWGLLGIYARKMEEILPKLHEAIKEGDYEKTARFAHNVKGSSANFRFEELWRLAQVLEQSAMERDESFEYEEAYTVLLKEYEKTGL